MRGFYILNLMLSVLLGSHVFSRAAVAKSCILINSYHQGYNYSDDIEREILKDLKGKCDAEAFYLDEKRNPEINSLKSKAKDIKASIEKLNPSVVVAIADAALEYVYSPYYSKSNIPFVFTAVVGNLINYKIPADNITGLSIKLLDERVLIELRKMNKDLKTIALIGDKSRINTDILLKVYQNILKPYAIDVKLFVANDFQDWEKKFSDAQRETQAVFFGSLATMPNWDPKKGGHYVEQNIKIPVVGTSDIMMPYTALGIVKITDEYGDIAGDLAALVLNGTSPKNIPITQNKKFEYFVNEKIARHLQTKVSESFVQKARKYQSEE